METKSKAETLFNTLGLHKLVNLKLVNKEFRGVDTPCVVRVDSKGNETIIIVFPEQ